MARERCNAGCGRQVVYRWLRDDGEAYELCENHSASSAKRLTDLGFDMWLVHEDEECVGG